MKSDAPLAWPLSVACIRYRFVGKNIIWYWFIYYYNVVELTRAIRRRRVWLSGAVYSIVCVWYAWTYSGIRTPVLSCRTRGIYDNNNMLQHRHCRRIRNYYKTLFFTFRLSTYTVTSNDCVDSFVKQRFMYMFYIYLCRYTICYSSRLS